MTKKPPLLPTTVLLASMLFTLTANGITRLPLKPWLGQSSPSLPSPPTPTPFLCVDVLQYNSSEEERENFASTYKQQSNISASLSWATSQDIIKLDSPIFSTLTMGLPSAVWSSRWRPVKDSPSSCWSTETGTDQAMFSLSPSSTARRPSIGSLIWQSTWLWNYSPPASTPILLLLLLQW